MYSEKQICDMAFDEGFKNAFEKVYNVKDAKYNDASVIIQYSYFVTTVFSLALMDYINMIDEDPLEVSEKCRKDFKLPMDTIRKCVEENRAFQINTLVKETDPNTIAAHMIRVINSYYEIPSLVSLIATYFVENGYASTKQNRVVKAATEYEEAYNKLIRATRELKRDYERQHGRIPHTEKHHKPEGFHKAKHHKKKGRR